MPHTTEVNRPFPKKQLFAKFGVKSAQRDRFDADISRMVITHEISSRSIPALASGDITAIYVVSVLLKRKDYDTANIEFFFDGYHLDETEEECLFDAIRSSFSNISDLFSSYDEQGEDTTYTRVELMLDTSECDETMVNDALMQFVPFLFSLWQGKLTIEDK